MLESLKIFLLLFYFVQIYVIAESFLVALISVPLFACIEIHERDKAALRKKIFVWATGVAIPMLVFFYFSFTPSRYDPDKSFTTLFLQSLMIGVLAGIVLVAYIGSRSLEQKMVQKKPLLAPKWREGLFFLTIPLLLPVLIGMHVQYKIFQEKASDKIATDTLNTVQHLQENALRNHNSYQNSFENLKLNPENIPEGVVIYLNAKAVPPELTQVFPKEVFPYVDKKSYQVLVSLKNPHSRTTKYFVGNEKYEIRQLKKQLPW